jgi:mucolipin
MQIFVGGILKPSWETHATPKIFLNCNETWTEYHGSFLGCLNLTVEPNVTAKNYSSKAYLKEHGITINFSALVRAVMKFSLKTVNFKAAGPITPPDCYKFNIKVRIGSECM